jgi:hypothetical protein
MRYTADVTVVNTIAVLLPSISGVSAINPLVAFYDIHGGKRAMAKMIIQKKYQKLFYFTIKLS